MVIDPKNATVPVTGGAGFAGSGFALHWRYRHPESTVIVLDNLKRRGSELNLTPLEHAGVQFVHGDFRNASDLEGFPRIDALVECSAEPSVLAGYGGAADHVVDTNLLFAANCLLIVARNHADLVLLITSRHVDQWSTGIPNYVHHEADIRERDAEGRMVMEYNSDFSFTVLAAALPSHDEAADIPFLDFEVNTTTTLNLLEFLG